MNAVPILFLSLFAVASSYVAPPTDSPVQDQCGAGPEVFCASATLISDCNAEASCQEYLHQSPCKKGPKVYCESPATALSCNKEAYCLTWPDDSVSAVRVQPPSTSTNQPNNDQNFIVDMLYRGQSTHTTSVSPRVTF